MSDPIFTRFASPPQIALPHRGVKATPVFGDMPVGGANVDATAAASGWDPVANAEANPNGAMPAPPPIGMRNPNLPPGVTVGLPTDAQMREPAGPPPQRFEPTYDASGKVTGAQPVTSHVEVTGPALPSTKHILDVTAPKPTPPDMGPVVTGTSPAGSPPPAPGASAQPAPKDGLDAQLAKWAAMSGGKGAGGSNPFQERIKEAQRQSGIGPEAMDAITGRDEATWEQKQALDKQNAESQRYAGALQKQTDEDRVKRAALDKKMDAAIANSRRDHVAEYWQTHSRGASLLAAAVGGALQGWNKMSSNPAMDAINHDIDRHVEDAREGDRAALEGVKATYQHFLDATHDERAAAAMTHASLLEGASTELSKGALDAQDAGHREKLLEANNAVKMQVAEYRDQGRIAAQRAASAGAMTPERLLKLEKDALDIKKTEAETRKIDAEAANGPPGAEKRTIVVDGQPRRAVSEQAAKDYKEFSDTAPDVNKAFTRLKDAWQKGDVGAYEAARGQLIDSMPKYMLGSSASGPTRAQAEETYGKIIPEYRHWYNPTGGMFTQGRTDSALDVAEKMLRNRAETIEGTTFGDDALKKYANAPPPPIPGLQRVPGT